MHTSFTGTARKSRQVNLSGRNSVNPWANLPGSTHPAPSGSGTHNAVAQAQAERLRRQQERDRVSAARKIQKTWRGHVSRTAQKQKWRELWDSNEAERLHLGRTADLSRLYPIQPYTSEAGCLSQLNLFVRFYNVAEGTDIARLLYVGDVLQKTLQEGRSFELDQSWIRNLRRLANITSKQIEHSSLQIGSPSDTENRQIRLLGLNTFITGVVPNDVALDAPGHFHALKRVLAADSNTNLTIAAVSGFAMTILSHTTDHQSDAFSALVQQLLGTSEMQTARPLLEFLCLPRQQNLVSLAVLSYVQPGSKSDATKDFSIDNRLWLLSYLVYLRKDVAKAGTNDSKSFSNWLRAVSILLSQCANDIAMRIDETDQPMNGEEYTSVRPLSAFIREQISTLSQQNNVVHIMDQLRSIGGQNESASVMAKPLANYAVALLRAFPRRAGNIRMWLYRGSPSISGDQSISTIRYLWQASEKTGIFQKIRDHKNVISVLTEAAPEHNQIGRPQVSAVEIAVWQEEWRIVLLFMELYTFILKLMDDEEFFALDQRTTIRSTDSVNTTFQRGALPLDDVSHMTTFLKNLAFSLYCYAADLDESNEIEEAGGLAALFGTATVESQRPVEKKKPQTLAGNSVSQAYLKGLVTGLLRMLHERDSRRKFLPDGHWLMTSQFDMQGFIPAVVLEEERRHEFGDIEEDMEGTNEATALPIDADGDDSDPIVPSVMNMFGIRAPHIPRTQTSRFAEQMRKRKETEKRKRQYESLAPRLEILRNLPFFIPFETRVQIFREFIYCDQMKRRKGYIDADQWRMSVAHSTQGRGPDGRPRGLDLINRHRAEIRRGSVFGDAYDQFYDLGDELKEPIQISFIDQFGAPEAGIDGGGVTKEFLISVTSEALNPNSDLQLFVENEQRFLYPNPTKLEAYVESLQRSGTRPGSDDYKQKLRALMQQYEFLGRVVGKCLYEGILVDIVFAGFFLLKWALTGGSTSATNETAYRASINDLRDFDDSFYQGLLKLKNYTGDVESDFGLNFTVSDEIQAHGKACTTTRDLLPNGSKIAVTNANRLVYIDKITRYRLQQQPSGVTNAFLRGLGQIIQPMWLAMFNQRELQKLVGGDNAELDIADLRRNTQYGGLYVIGDDGLEHPTVALFWKVLKTMDDEDRRKVLKFVTSTPRAPLLGFGHLNPKFSIRDSSEDQTRLPSTSTCVNLLKLPRYGDEKTMREKLLYAVNSGAGFDLS